MDIDILKEIVRKVIVIAQILPTWETIFNGILYYVQTVSGSGLTYDDKNFFDALIRVIVISLRICIYLDYYVNKSI